MSVYRLIVSMLGPLLAAVIGSMFTISALPVWYESLNKPFFNPPDWLFAPVWTVLYLLMGIASYLIWQSSADRYEKQAALTLFYVQLAINVLWSILFFGLRLPVLALGEIIILWLLIALATSAFWRINKSSARLLWPYLIWVTFAAILNGAIVWLN